MLDSERRVLVDSCLSFKDIQSNLLVKLVQRVIVLIMAFGGVGNAAFGGVGNILGLDLVLALKNLGLVLALKSLVLGRRHEELLKLCNSAPESV